MSLVFGKYEKIRRIAQGGMGEVFLTRQTGVLDRLAILKSLRTDLAIEREFVDQFLDEARVAATLNHPNIVSIYDVGEHKGVYYIAMEYVPGEDLSKLWYAAAKAGVGLPFQVSVRICYEAALGLDHAHKARDVRGSPLNIVHRDVSPQNIMVRGDGVVKLVDFGIAKAANKASRTQAGMVKGKLQYMSPEQVRGEALDGRSDQFSLGVVLWEMCTGRRLFKADTEINTLQKILQSPIPKPSEHVPGFPAELENAILKMLQRDVEKRFKHLGDVASDLKNYLDRAALASGETSVAAFVQQILGKELEDRVKDLTPMDTTTDVPGKIQREQMQKERERASASPSSSASAGASSSLAPQPSTGSGISGKQAARPAPGAEVKPAPNDLPTQVLDRDASDEQSDKDNLGQLPSSPPGGEWAVRRAADGSVMHFGEMSTLHQWILDLQVGPDDSFTADGRTWKKLRDAPQFQKFLEIAAAASAVAQKSGSRPAAGPKTAPQSSHHTVTRPVQAADPNNPVTLALGNPYLDEQRKSASGEADSTDPQTGAFSLGDLPASQTGTWGAPEIALAVASARAAADKGPAYSPQAAQPAAGGEGQLLATPTTRENQSGGRRGPQAQQRAAGVPTFVWMLGGITVALAGVAVALVVLAPDVLETLTGSSSTTETLKAIAAARSDDTQAIDALVKTYEAQIDSADALAAAALLHVARARIDDQTEKIAAMLNTLGAKVDALPDAEGHRVAAYRVAKAAVERDPESPGALLAMAVYQGERAALAEMQADADRATAAAKGSSAAAPAVAAELELARALLPARAALAGNDGPLHSVSADKLDPVDDARARTLARVLRARAAMVAMGALPPDVDAFKRATAKLKDAVATAAADDPRTPMLAELLKRLEKKVEEQEKDKSKRAVVPPPVSAPPSLPPVVASAVDAGPGEDVAAADAGVRVATAPPSTIPPPPPSAAAPPPEPETYESVIEKARRASRAMRSKDASRLAKKALELKPGSIEALIILGDAYIDLGANENGRIQFRNVLKQDPKNCAAQMGVAISLDNEQRTVDARAEYLKYVELCPDGKEVEAAKNAAARLE